MTKLYEIIGLTKTTIAGNSYETNSKNYILKDETTGRGITKTRMFTRYILYVAFENSYYAVHLSNHDCASFSGKLCHTGTIQILHVNYDDVQSNITHFPIQPLFVFADFEVKEYDYDAFMDVYLHNEPDTFVFKFSGIGDDESVPCGYVYVNMELFQDSL